MVGDILEIAEEERDFPGAIRDNDSRGEGIDAHCQQEECELPKSDFGCFD